MPDLSGNNLHVIDNIGLAKDEAWVTEQLRAVCHDSFDGARIAAVATEHIQRRVLRYTLDLDSSDACTPRTVIAKVYRDPESARRSFETTDALWSAARRTTNDSHVPFPEAYGVLAEASVVLMQDLPGDALRQTVRDMTATPDDMRRFARAVATLHRLPVDIGPERTAQTLLAAEKDRPRAIADRFPDLAPTVDRILAALDRLGSTQSGAHHTLTHGDLHLGQVQVAPGAAWIIDLDPVGQADPALDLAEIFLNLKRFARKNRMRLYIEGLRDAFVVDYFSEMDWQIAAREPLYESLIHLKRACKCFRVQDEEDWEDDMRTLLHQARTCLQTLETGIDTPDLQSTINLWSRTPGEV